MALKRLIKTVISGAISAAILWMGAGLPAHAAGTIPIALAQQVDINGQPLANCQVSFFVAGTPATPQTAYADFGLSQPLGNPLSCDQTGRVPMFWLADGLIHVQLTDVNGLVILDTTMQVLGPSSGGGGGGGGGTVDPTTIFATGDIKARYGIGGLTGFVRLNGLTIGNATSGATERANADTQNLFVYLWNTDANLVVSGGRGGSALSDFNASKTIALPDWRGQALAALADMGNSATSLLTATYFGTSPIVLGASGGNQSHTHVIGEIPAITSSAVNSISVSGSNSFNASGNNTITVNSTIADIGVSPSSIVDIGTGGTGNRAFGGSVASLTGVTSTGVNSISVAGSVSINSSGNNSISVTSTGTSGNAFSIVPPMKLATFYMKL